MNFYILRQQLTLQTAHGRKTIPGCADMEQAQPAAIHVASAHELALVRDLVVARDGAAALDRQLRVVPDTALAHWPAFPCRLGRYTLNLAGPGRQHDHSAEAAPLVDQLRRLRALKTEQGHFRIALVNGFGSNLGDNLVGASALRHVAAAIAAALPSFAIDCLFSSGAHPACRDFMTTVPAVRQAFFGGLSLAEFGRYDAYFDFSAVLAQARYGSLPMVDFYLWSMGLDPDAIAPAAKRNRIAVPAAARAAVAGLLNAAPAPRVLFGHRASVALRSIAPAQARQLLRQLLDGAPDWTVVLDAGLGLAHPRLLDLDGKIDDVDKLQALVAQVDGVVCVDSLTQHLADACAVPTLMLCASLPASHFPYYPQMEVVIPPGMASLPGWGRTKVADARWPAMRDDYARAWGALDGAALGAQLRRRMQSHARAPCRPTPWLPVSWGELFDKLTILDIKAEKIADRARLANIARERGAIAQVLAQAGPLPEQLDELVGQLRQVNRALWEIEDGKRDCERRQCFDAAFIALARRVYLDNDRRTALKRRISALLGSAIVEEKVYQAY